MWGLLHLHASFTGGSPHWGGGGYLGNGTERVPQDLPHDTRLRRERRGQTLAPILPRSGAHILTLLLTNMHTQPHTHTLPHKSTLPRSSSHTHSHCSSQNIQAQTPKHTHSPSHTNTHTYALSHKQAHTNTCPWLTLELVSERSSQLRERSLCKDRLS